MYEKAAKYVLFDFEIIFLVTLFLGLIAYAIARKAAKKTVGPPSYWLKIDLILIFIPALLYLVQPIALVFMDVAQEGLTEGEDPNNVKQLVAIVANLICFFLVGIITYVLIEWIGERTVTQVCGLKRMSLPMVIVFTIIIGALSLIACNWFLGGLSQEYLISIFGELDEQEPVQMFKKSGSSLHMFLTIALACVVAPIVEEFFFRGYMYGVVRKFTSPVFSALVTSALFAVVHVNLPALLPLWVFALILTAAYEYTRSIWVPIGIHAFFNAANVLMLLASESAEAS